MSGSKVAASLIDDLIEQGVDTVFAVPGEQLSPLFEALHHRRDRIATIHTRHEQAAAYMAYGYARAEGTMGVCIVPPGPGVLNALAGLSVAYATCTPVLCLTGQIPVAAIGKNLGYLHELPDQLGALRAVTKWAGRIASAADYRAMVDTALVAMRSGRPGPVALEVPPEVLREGVQSSARHRPRATAAHSVGDRARLVSEAAELLAQACRPLIVVGGGAIGAREPLGRLAERLQAPVVSNGAGRGIVSSRNLLAANLPAGYLLWKTVDVVLAVGTRLGRPYCEWGYDDDMRVIRIDCDHERVSDVTTSIGIVGDAADIVKSIEALLAEHEGAPSRHHELEALRTQVEGAFAELSPQHEYVHALRLAIPDDGILVDELTQIGYACRIAYPVYEPRTYITSGYQGALGFGFSTALGAKVACPTRAVVSINGDGGFLYTANELATAVQQKLGVVTVVFNDASYGNIARDQAASGYQLGTALHNPDFVAYARAFGAIGLRVDSPDSLGDAVAASLAQNVPSVIEVPIGAMPDPWPLIRLPRARARAKSSIEVQR
jgi:acetolactate synthase I/II/III large subunit